MEMRKSFIVNATFDTPAGGEVMVQATDEKHATDLVKKMLHSKKNLEIIDVYEVDGAKFLEQSGSQSPPSDATIN